MFAAAMLALAFVPGTFADVPGTFADVPVHGDGSPQRIESPGHITTVWHADGATSATVPVLAAESDERAYLPTAGWEPGTPPSVRRQAIAGGLLMSALILVAVLLPKRRTLAVLVVAGVLTVGIVAWSATRDPVRTLTGTVWLEPTGRADVWTWYRSAEPTTLDVPADRRTFPVAFDRRHLAAIAPEVHVDAVGQIVSLRLHLPADVPMAVVRIGEGEPAPGIGDSALRTMVRKWYLRPGVEIAAEGEAGMVLREIQ